jgi:hypothetical protein
VLGLPTFRSPCVILSPRLPSANHTGRGPPHAEPAVHSHRQLSGHRVSSTRNHSGMRATLTCRSPCVVHSLQCLSPIRTDACHPLAEPTLGLTHQRYSHQVSSARPAVALPDPPMFLSPCVICSSHWVSSSYSVMCHLGSALAVCATRPVSGRCVDYARRKCSVLSLPILRSLRVICPPCPCSNCHCNILVTACFHSP